MDDRGRRGALWLAVLAALGFGWTVAAGCGDGAQSPPGPGPVGGQAGATTTTGGSGGAGAVGGVGGSGGAGGSGACAHAGQLGDECEDDCDCGVEHGCRGLPGDRACRWPCQADDQCAPAVVGCQDAGCDLNTGACHCGCTEASCPDDVCVMSYCVGCSTDEHCEGHSCGVEPGLDEPRCQLDAASCVCGGVCGDGVCDPAEQAVQLCPADCTGPCQDGAILPYSCVDGSLTAWCTCVSGSWQCGADPASGCPGATPCEQLGGMCIDDPAECYAPSQVAADPQGCSGATPLCCEAPECVPAGMGYPPIGGSGACCPGLRALSSAAPLGLDSGDVTCFANCWMLTCAPCGDGTCEPQLGENFCNCPEDCPQPPYPLACADQMVEGCGRAFCRQEGNVCHQETPTCNASDECERDLQDLPGQMCDPLQGACQ